MTLVSLGDLAQSYLLRRQTTGVKADVQRLSHELTTGQVTDTAARLSGDMVPLSGIDTSLARLKGFSSVTSEAALLTGVMQTTLGTIDEMASNLGASLIAASSGGAPAGLSAVASDARQQFETTVSLLNTRFGDRSVFAGIATANAALMSSDSLMATIDGVVAGAASAGDAESALDAWFAAPSGFAATAYTGGNTLAPMVVAPEETAQVDISAKDPTIAATLKGLAMAALLDRGMFAGSPEARQDLAKRAGIALAENLTGRAHLMARLGTVQAQIDSASVRNEAEASALHLARAELVEAEPYETALRLQEAESQLEKIFTITARLSRLSLVDFLR
jgi:flagellar hook-associated protein 3 FlgL